MSSLPKAVTGSADWPRFERATFWIASERSTITPHQHIGSNDSEDWARLTTGDVKEVLSAGSVDLDVALSDVVLVLAQRQVAVLFAVETDQRLAVTTTLLAQA